MKPGQASRTAQYVAMFRALETARPADERLFEDGYAESFLSGRQRWLVRAARLPVMGTLVRRAIEQRSAGAFSSAVARTAWLDERLRVALAAGIGQVVILGTGFDCRAYRLPEVEQATVFEVDHADKIGRAHV